MKNPIKEFVIVVMLIFPSVMYATQLSNKTATSIVLQVEKTEISVEDLPDVVREGFNLSDYSSMVISKIFKVVDQEGTVTYEFVLGDNNDTVIFSEKGKVVE